MATQRIDAPLLISQKSLRDLAVLLVRDANLHEGLFDISFELQTAIGSFGPIDGQVLPGAIFGIKSVGLLPAQTMNQHTIDAAEVNPVKASEKKPAARRALTRGA
jgi:hypothetical protein